MKLTIIGGGSTYTPELVYGFLKDENPEKEKIDNIVIHDINPERLRTVGEYCQALARDAGAGINVTLDDNIVSSLKGADFVVTQIRVGGNETRARDEKFVRELGLVAQETTGAVGFLKAFRTIPVMTTIARQVQEICPNAFLINFTNPVGIVTTAIRNATGKHNLAGLCNVPVFMQKNIEKMIERHKPDLYERAGKSKKKSLFYSDVLSGHDEKLFLSWGGLNHLSWVFDLIVGGVSIFDEVMEIIKSDKYDPEEFFPINREYAMQTGTIPSPYLRYYTDTEKIIREQYNKPVRGEEVMEIEKELLGIYQMAAHRMIPGVLSSLPEKLSDRGGADYSRLAVKLVKCFISGNPKCVHILNVPDFERYLDSAGDFVEIPVTIKRTETSGTKKIRFQPIYPQINRIKPQVVELLEQVRSYERLTVESGLTRNRELARQALKIHPLIQNHAIDKILTLL